MTLAHLTVFAGVAAVIAAVQHGVITGSWYCAALTITAAFGWYVAAVGDVIFGDLAFWTTIICIVLAAGWLTISEKNSWPILLGAITIGALWFWRSRP